MGSELGDRDERQEVKRVRIYIISPRNAVQVGKHGTSFVSLFCSIMHCLVREVSL